MKELTRRTLLGGGALLAGDLLVRKAVGAPQQHLFPDGFLWGASTAGHQIEGNDLGSDLWVLENVQPTIYVERSGDADDSYNRYEEDITLLRSFGLNAYRFSIEWSRIEPTKDKFSVAELDHYKRMIEFCRGRGVAPSVTFHHNASPAWFAAEGGWLSKDSSALFGRYCDKAARALADQMEVAFTINEPQASEVIIWIPGAAEYLGSWTTSPDSGFRKMKAAGAKAVGSSVFEPMFLTDPRIATPNIINAHHEAFAAIKAVRGNLPTGVPLAVPDFQGVGPSNRLEEARKFIFGPWIEAAKKSGDFVGVQNYTRYRVDARGPQLPPKDVPMPTGGEEIYPQSLANAVTYIHHATGKPIIVSEHGINTTNDPQRVKLIDDALIHLRNAIAAGVPVLGYYHWSLLDNFEWFSGYTPKFGLVAVDRNNFVRTPKPSAFHLGSIARTNGSNLT